MGGSWWSRERDLATGSYEAICSAVGRGLECEEKSGADSFSSMRSLDVAVAAVDFRRRALRRTLTLDDAVKHLDNGVGRNGSL